MPHYRNGEEAQVGDIVVGKDWQGKRVVGEITNIMPSSTTCNMTVSYVVQRPVAQDGTFTVGEFDLLHRDTDAGVLG